MSLYDESEVDSKGAAGWSSGIKMLQSHVQLRKATGHHLQRKNQTSSSTSIAPVLDLNTRLKDRISAEDMPPIPLYVGRGGASLLGGEWFLKDEYDPSYPNEYERLVKQLRRESRKEKRSSASTESNSTNAMESPPHSDRGSSSKRQSAMIAPPASLTAPSEGGGAPSTRSASPPAPHTLGVTAVASNMGCSSVAAKIMARMGFRAGQGLGKSEQGMASALAVEKTSHRGGKIVDVSSTLSASSGSMTDIQPSSASFIGDQDSTFMGPPPPPSSSSSATPPHLSSSFSNQMTPTLPSAPAEEQSITEILKNPTKVVLLRNMVGPGEVDEELEPETKEECGRYGEVVKCVIYELPGPGVCPEEAVRIFVEYKNLAHAIKAVVDLNGRFFGGRVVRAGFYEQEKFNRLELI